MRFSDGEFLMQPGYTSNHPVEVSHLKTGQNELTVYCPIKKIKHRYDSLDQALLTASFSSPAPNVIRVKLFHHQGSKLRKPEYLLNVDSSYRPKIVEDNNVAYLTSGDITVRINKSGDWRIDYMNGDSTLTSSGPKGIGMVQTPQGHFMHERLSIAVGECIYGLGERFTAFVKNGQTVDVWNKDGGTSTDQAYKNVPFYLSNRGYGVFVNHPELVSYEIATERVKCAQFSVAGERLEYFIIFGPSLKEVLERYTALTGRPALPPAWSFGLWLTTSFTTDYDEKTVTSFIEGMEQRDLPLHVFHFDCFWMKAFNWCNFEWDSTCFPDPVAMLKRLKERGLRICVWINPYIAQCSTMFEEGMQKGFLVMRPNGDVWQVDTWQAGMGLVDFTNPNACRWYSEKLKVLLDMGVDCFKTDFGERIPTDVVYHDGSDPQIMHNYYTQLYNRCVFDLLESERGKGEAVLFARSATAGGQQFPVHWGGDCTASFESMAESLRGGLSLCLSGFGYWSHDIGGFEETASPDVYKRWCAFGLLSSHSRLHGNKSYRVPWIYDEEAVDVLRQFTKLKCRLMPYLFEIAAEAHTRGVPMMRAMVLEFPNDPGCDYLDRQYMLGDSLLVAPIFSRDGSVDYYLPVGRWTNFISGATVEGGRWISEEHNFFSLPLMVRPNSVIAVGSDDSRPDYDYLKDLTFHLFEIGDGANLSKKITSTKGEDIAEFRLERRDKQISIVVSGILSPWKVLMRGFPEINQVEGGTHHSDDLGYLIEAKSDVWRMVIHLS